MSFETIGTRWPEQIMVLWGWNRFYGIGPVLPDLERVAILKRQYADNTEAMADLNRWYPTTRSAAWAGNSRPVSPISTLESGKGPPP